MDGKMKNKRGQLAIWVILAIIIVASILILFFVVRKPVVSSGDQLDPENYIEKCTKDAVNEALDKMLPQGGFVNPENYKIYQDNKIEYLCENIGNYKPCVNQHPMFVREITGEIKDYITPKIDSCFRTLKSDWEKRSYDVNLGTQTVDVELMPGKVLVNIQRETVLAKNEQTKRLNEFKISIVNPIYDLALVAIEIANQEAKYCYFEYVGYMALYPKFSIEKFAMSDSTKIYTIQDKNGNKELNIAVRGCAIPPGI